MQTCIDNKGSRKHVNLQYIRQMVGMAKSRWIGRRRRSSWGGQMERWRCRDKRQVSSVWHIKVHEVTVSPSEHQSTFGLKDCGWGGGKRSAAQLSVSILGWSRSGFKAPKPVNDSWHASTSHQLFPTVNLAAAGLSFIHRAPAGVCSCTHEGKQASVTEHRIIPTHLSVVREK